MAQDSRLRYPMFKDKEGDDPDLFLQEFDLTTDANHLGYTTKVVNQLNNLRQERDESLRQYTQQYKDLVCRAGTNDIKVLVEWYCGRLPPRIAHYCRQGPQMSINDVIARVEEYETARQTEFILKEKGKDRKHKKKSHREYDSSSSSSSEESSSSSDSKEEERSHRRRKSEKDKKKKKKSSHSLIAQAMIRVVASRKMRLEDIGGRIAITRSMKRRIRWTNWSRTWRS
ncbi:hypothetical protein R1flu_008038 [Riccia fluitans]|uniref:Retrotransposon gag domain-containing protein n=1 Tax=Riccia fluitans TaxID=41844 RepID=A0ABD1YAR8_9MARC